MLYDDKLRLFTLKTGISVRLRNLTGEPWNLTITHITGRAITSNETDVTIRAEEVSWEKQRPEFHALTEYGGPITVEVKRNSISASQVLPGNGQAQWPDDIMRHHLQVIDSELLSATEILCGPNFKAKDQDSIIMAQKAIDAIRRGRAVILGITK